MLAAAAVAAGVVAGVALAPAAAAVVPNAAYGGGGLTPAAPLVALKVGPSPTRLTFEAELIARCAGLAPVDERMRLLSAVGPNGAFHATRSRTYRVSAAESRVVELTATGGLTDAAHASGTVRLVVQVRRPHRATVRCDSHVQPWQARSPAAAPAGPPVTLAGRSWFGRTSQVGSLPLPVAMRVAADGRSVDTAVFRVHRRCTGVPSNDVAEDAPAAPIDATGAFAVTHRFSQRFPDSIEAYTFSFAGRFAGDRVAGTLRATSIVRDLRTRRFVGRCDSGVVSWKAIP